MIKGFLKKIFETFISIIPMVFIITIIFLFSYFNNDFREINGDKSIPFISLSSYISFLICSLTLVIGSSLFQVGADNALSKVGQEIGSHLTKKKNIALLLILTIGLGLLITFAEPDLTVFSDIVGKQIDSKLGTWIVKLVAGLGVGTFLALGIVRIIFQKSFKIVILISYLLIFAICCFFGPDGGNAFLSISYDTSGVTTGPATVPFVIAFGASVASARGGKDSSSDSFGLSGLMSLGPVIGMLILTLIKRPECDIFSIEVHDWYKQVVIDNIFLNMIFEVLLGVGPIFLFFIIYNFIFLKLKRKKLINIIIGFLLTAIGLYIFLISASIGFKGLAFELGKNIASNPSYYYLFIIISLLTGVIIVLGEPSIQILTSQVEEISGGIIKKKTMIVTLAIGVGIAIALEVSRNVFFNGFSSFYLFIPLYLLCIILMFFVSDLYASIAFDSGGIASGTISVCFVLPFVIGICIELKTVTNAFGIIGMVSCVPILCIEMLGIVSKIQSKLIQRRARKSFVGYEDVQIIHFMELENEEN